MPDDLLVIADELYGLTLPGFTPARDRRSKDLKPADKELAAQVKSLRKPSLAAWVVNALVRHETEQVEQVLAVGTALREAQSSLDGEELRALTRQRRQLTAAVTTRARALASELGVKVTPAVADQVEATLTAAMIDEGCARAVRSGQLVTSFAATGVDEVDLARALATPEALGFSATAAVAEPETRPELHVVPDPDADAEARAAAEELLAGAGERLASATTALEDAAREVTDLEARSMQLQAEADELRRRLAEIESQAEAVDEELSDAEEVRAGAESAVGDATRERDAAAAALASLT